MSVRFLNAWGYQGNALGLPVADVGSAVSFYETTLGFQTSGSGTDPEAFAILERDAIKIGLVENGGDPTQDGCAFEVDNVVALLKEFRAKGLKKEVSDLDIEENNGKKWKVFYVVAPDGLCFWFGEKLEDVSDKR